MSSTPDADAELIDRIAEHLNDLAGPSGGPVRLEWSQAGTHHSGRLLVGSQRQGVSPDVTALMVQLRTQMAREGAGAWLSAIIHVENGQTKVGFNYRHRVYWNAQADSMLHRPAAPPVPDDARWQADLRRYPRDRQHLLTWLAAPVVASDAAVRLREALNQAGFPPGGVGLPGEDQIPFEGAVTLRRHSSAHYSLHITDYGQHEFLSEFAHEEQACRAVWDYLHQPLPAPVPMPIAELQQRAEAAADAYASLRRRLDAVGSGGLITNLATGVPFDRFGVLDGLFFYPWNTPWPERSLPDSARGPGSQQIVLMAPQPIEALVQLAPAWFDQPGGGIRFRVEDASHQGLRDLVRTGALWRVQPVG